MKIPLTLNGVAITINADPDTKLLEALRKENCVDVKCGCGLGLCGACAVLVNLSPVPACVVPVVAVRNCRIVTLEHYKTFPLYEDIQNGFKQAGVKLCGFCDAGKIFAAHDLITRSEHLSREQVEAALSSLGCRCVEENLLVNAVLYAATFKERRENRGKNVR
jgi:carbon-monoxide dehydrogenase small subunit